MASENECIGDMETCEKFEALSIASEFCNLETMYLLFSQGIKNFELAFGKCCCTQKCKTHQDAQKMENNRFPTSLRDE